MSVSGEQAAGRDDVDPDIEQRLEVRTEVDLVEERSAGLELDKQIMSLDCEASPRAMEPKTCRG